MTTMPTSPPRTSQLPEPPPQAATASRPAPPARTADSAEGRAAAVISGLAHRYGSRLALASLDLTIERGEIFAVLGPNGGGKTTLFRVLSTLIPLQEGQVQIAGCDLRRGAAEIRARIGVVFQAPSLDRKLTVAENIDIQGALYGLAGRDLAARRDMLLAQFGLADRARELTEKLSGGLRRRVELAKGLIHEPELLLLDEPSTGLDPAARSDLWRYLKSLRDERGTTVILTTHFLDEADGADRIAILNEGRLVALGRPDDLRAEVGGDSITIETLSPTQLATAIHEKFGVVAKVVDASVRLEVPAGHEWIARLVEAFPGQISAIRLGKPTLEDVFIARTGHRFWREQQGPEA
ncbi:MAG: ABC transporter ATP-binding protein [Planctomycetaceae bacterium]|nr:ABC transporter ATP-binding protein [Planctomycetaceae bacterium]